MVLLGFGVSSQKKFVFRRDSHLARTRRIRRLCVLSRRLPVRVCDYSVGRNGLLIINVRSRLFNFIAV